MNNNKPKRTNSVFYDSREKKHIENYKYDYVYFGTPNKIDNPMKLDGVIFVTPLKGIASIFAVRPQNLSKYGVKRDGSKINRNYKEWSTRSTEYLKELHVIIEGAPYIKDTEENVHGYVYELKLTPELREHIWWGDNMSSPDLEVVLKDLDEIKFDNVKELDITMYITGAEQKKTHQESYINNLSEFNHFFQETPITSNQRDKLNDSDFGIPELRKYPLHDKSHVEAAVKMFPHAPLKYRKSLAKRILNKANEYDIDTSNWKSLKPYMESCQTFFEESHKTHFQRTMERLDFDEKTKTIKTALMYKGKPLRLKLIIDNSDGNDTCFIHFTKSTMHRGTKIPDYSSGELHIARKLLKSKSWYAMYSIKHEEGHSYVFYQLAQEVPNKNNIDKSNIKNVKASIKILKDQVRFNNDMNNAIDTIAGHGDVLSEHGLKPDEYVADKYSAEHTSKRSAIKSIERMNKETYISERNKRVKDITKELNKMIDKKESLTEKDISSIKKTISDLGLIIADLFGSKKIYKNLPPDIIPPKDVKALLDKIDEIGELPTALKISQIQQNYMNKLSVDKKIDELYKARDIAEKSQDCYMLEMKLRKQYIEKYVK